MKKYGLQAGVVLSLILFLLPACKKNGGKDAGLEPALMIVQASPDAPPVRLSLNGNVQKADSQFAFPGNTGYRNIPVGDMAIRMIYKDSLQQVIARDSTVDTVTIDTVRTILEFSTHLDANKAYSIFTYDTANAMKTMLLSDDLRSVTDGKARIRFLQLSPGMTKMDVLANGNPLFTGRSFADNVAEPSVAGFQPVDAGTYEFILKGSGADTALFTLPGITVAAGGFYTIFSRGRVADTGTQAPGLQWIINYEPPE